MIKKIFRKETIIGICVLLALAILFFGIQYLKGVSIFKPSNYYYAVFTDVKEMALTAPVNVNGVKIGQVDDIELMYDRPGHVLVSFSIDKKYHIPVGSQVMLASDLLGTTSLTLSISNNTENYLPGDTIPGVIESGLMDKLGEDLLPGVNQVIPHVDSLLVSLNNIAGNPSIIATLQNLEATTATLRTTMISLNSSVSQLPPVMNDVKEIASRLNSITADLNKLTTSLADAPIDSTLQNINAISADLSQLTAQLNNPDSNIGKLLNDTQLYDNLIKTTADIDSLLVDIKKNPKRYISIKLL